MKKEIDDLWKGVDFTLRYTDDELRKIFPDYKVGETFYYEYCIRYRHTLQQLIQTCREDHVILVYGHDGYPQSISAHAIVVKDSQPYHDLMRTDDYSVVVDISKYLEYLNSKAS